jgi:hypothetical protein
MEFHHTQSFTINVSSDDKNRFHFFFSVFTRVQTGSGAHLAPCTLDTVVAPSLTHPASYPMGTGGAPNLLSIGHRGRTWP